MAAIDIVISLIKGSAALGTLAFAFQKLVPHFDHGNRRATWPRAFAVAATLIAAGFLASLFEAGPIATAVVQLAVGGVAGKIAFGISIPLSIAVAFLAELIVAAVVLGVAILVTPLVMMSPLLAGVALVITVAVLTITRWPRRARQ